MAQINVADTIIAIRKTRDDEKHLPIIDNTRLTAVNTCPRWAGVRYGHNKIMGSGTSRALALEVGTALHHSFGAIRLHQLARNGYVDHAMHHARRLFPRDGAYEEARSIINAASSTNEGDLTALRELGLFGIEYSRYEDDEKDKKRTRVNMEEAIIKYANRYNLSNRIWVSKQDKPEATVGIEIPFDVIIDIRARPGVLFSNYTTSPLGDEGKQIRFVGRLDGLVFDSGDNLLLEENKTTAQINATWITQWEMSHQLTGYIVVARQFAMLSCEAAEVIGLAIPQPKTSPYDGLVRVPATRSASRVNQWLQWFVNSVLDFEDATAAPLEAATFTHSCTRYFRECSMLPLCASDREEQEDIFNNQMTIQEWNPLSEDVAE